MAEKTEEKDQAQDEGILVESGRFIIDMGKLEEFSPKLAELVRKSEAESKKKIEIISSESLKGVEQIKIFAGERCDNFQKLADGVSERANAWLRENKGIKIIERKLETRVAGNGNGQTYCTFAISIYYTR